jgi:5-methylcytosine-specific restriction endonuclease McrA
MTAWAGRKAQQYAALTFATYGRVCWLCGQQGANSVDHVTPLQHGGAPYDLANMRPAHLHCNQARGNRTRHAPARATPSAPNRTSRRW